MAKFQVMQDTHATSVICKVQQGLHMHVLCCTLCKLLSGEPVSGPQDQGLVAFTTLLNIQTTVSGTGGLHHSDKHPGYCVCHVQPIDHSFI
jgi:hypothetical protein